MKKLLGLCLFVSVLCSCGEQNSVNLDEGGANYSLDAGRSSCSEEFQVALKQTKATSFSPKIKFVANNALAVSHQDMGNKATIAQRCGEIRNHFSGGPINSGAKAVPNEFSLELGFSATAEQESQLLLGKTVEMNPESADFAFTDGSLNGTASPIEIRCPGLAKVSCQVTEIGDYKKCDSYKVTFSEMCTFRGRLVSFKFSDLKSALLDVNGELNMTANRDAEMKFTAISWMILN